MRVDVAVVLAIGAAGFFIYLAVIYGDLLTALVVFGVSGLVGVGMGWTGGRKQ
jgi:hypothetical protein